jgi:hypothetical protein
MNQLKDFLQSLVSTEEQFDKFLICKQTGQNFLKIVNHDELIRLRQNPNFRRR